MERGETRKGWKRDRSEGEKDREKTRRKDNAFEKSRDRAWARQGRQEGHQEGHLREEGDGRKAEAGPSSEVRTRSKGCT
jgi:hypothetical protein